MSSVRVRACAILALSGLPSPFLAQTGAPDGADRWTVEMAADSLKAFNEMTARLRHDQRNAELWFQRGMLAWALYERARRQPPVPGLRWPILVHAVDTSFQRAMRLDPAHEGYFVAAARFAIASNLAFRPGTTTGLIDESIERARATGDHDALATVLVPTRGSASSSTSPTCAEHTATSSRGSWSTFPPSRAST